MIQKLQLNDVVVAENLMVYYCEDEKTKPHPKTLFSTSKDAYSILMSYPQNYFKHLVSKSHVGAQFITDNFELVLRKGSALHKIGKLPQFDCYAKNINIEVLIKDNINIAVSKNERVLLIYNLMSEKCKTLYNKTTRLHEATQ